MSVLPSVLLIDDDRAFRERLASALRKRSFDVREAGDVAAGIRLATDETPEFAIVDLRMPGPSGLEAVHKLHELDSTTRILVLTGFGSIATAVDAIKLGAVHYLSKPADVDQILAALGFEKSDGDRSESNIEGARAGKDVPIPSLARVEWEHIQRVLNECDHNISKAAKLLGIHRRSLQRKLSKTPSAT